MPPRRDADRLSEAFRREVFRTLVEAQDRGAGAELSRRTVARRFGVTPAEVRRIEYEGLANDWPPL